MLGENSYFMVIFLNMEDRDKGFEGGPYFYNRIGLFIRPWHAIFNSTEEIPSRVLVWIRLPRLPLEFWQEDILHKISSLLGKHVAVATHISQESPTIFDGNLFGIFIMDSTVRL